MKISELQSCLKNIIICFHFSFKNLLRNVTFLKETTINFLKNNRILKTSIVCPSPCVEEEEVV